MTDLAHRSSRVVDQRPEVVHERLLELANRLREDLPPITPGTQAATLLGITGSLGIEVADRGPERIEIRTTRGRVRADAAAAIRPNGDGQTELSMGVKVWPRGFAANVVLGAALAARPRIQQDVIDGLERAMTDLARELAKPDGEWDASAWQPPGLP
jgi:hypothetical protein